MTTQYLRNLSLIVADPNGDGLELGSFRVVFIVRRGDLQTPNETDARIYNLNDNTAYSICAGEYTQIQLKAGYGSDEPNLIFRGSIKQTRNGRLDQKDSYVDITAADGDEAYNFAYSAFTLAAGAAVPRNAIERLIGDMARRASSSPTNPTGGQPIGAGYIPDDLPGNVNVRGRTYFGRSCDEMRDVTGNVGCKWFTDDGKVTVVPQYSYIPGDPVLISPQTGLIGMPEQTQNGLQIRVLLNPSIKIGQLIKLDATINKFRLGNNLESVAVNNTLLKTALLENSAGLYYVMRADHVGDTRGEEWYTDMTCLAVNSSAPLFSQPQSAILPGSAIKPY